MNFIHNGGDNIISVGFFGGGRVTNFSKQFGKWGGHCFEK